MVVDFTAMTTLGEMNLEEIGLDSRVMALSCGHVFTVETLDVSCPGRVWNSAPPAD